MWRNTFNGILWVFVTDLSFHELQLAIFAEKLVAAFAFERFERELTAHDALDLFNHLSLELILDFVHLNIKSWNGLWTHHNLNSLIRDNKIHSCIDRKSIFFGIHLLEDRLHSPLLHVHLSDWHIFLKFLKIIYYNSLTINKIM